MGAKRHEALNGLTIKEHDFIDRYLFGTAKERGNASECYRNAFNYKGKDTSSWVEACRLMALPHIKETLNSKVDSMTSEAVIKEGIRRETETKYARDRLKAWELLGKTHAMFKEKVEHEVNIGDLMVENDLTTRT